MKKRETRTNWKVIDDRCSNVILLNQRKHDSTVMLGSQFTTSTIWLPLLLETLSNSLYGVISRVIKCKNNGKKILTKTYPLSHGIVVHRGVSQA